MHPDHRFVVTLVGVIAAGLTAIALTIAGGTAMHSYLMVRYGYCETMLPGSATGKWVKCQ